MRSPPGEGSHETAGPDGFDEDETDDPHNKQPGDDSDVEWTVDEDMRTD